MNIQLLNEDDGDWFVPTARVVWYVMSSPKLSLRCFSTLKDLLLPGF